MKREEKMSKRRSAGKTYTYKSNPYEKDSREYRIESVKRAMKNRCKKLRYSQMRSVFAKLDNLLETERITLAKKKQAKTKENK